MSLLTEQEIQAIWNVESNHIPSCDRHFSFARAIEAAVIEKIKAHGKVGVFADTNKLNDRGPLWEQMIAESYDGKDFIYLYRLPGGD